MLEPISLRFENRREKEAARRQIGASGRKQVSVTAAPTERPWRPRTPSSQLPLVYYVWSAETDELVRIDFIAVLPATLLLCFKFGCPGNKNRCAHCDYDRGMVIAEEAESTNYAMIAKRKFDCRSPV
jgi:hypothetical protein